EERRTLGELAREIGLTGLDLPLELVPPRGEAVDPGDDRVLPPAELLHGDGAEPAVVPEMLHRRLAPFPRAGRAMADRRAEHVVAVGEDRRADLEGLAERPFRRPPPAVEARPDLLDLDAGRAAPRRARHPSTLR